MDAIGSYCAPSSFKNIIVVLWVDQPNKPRRITSRSWNWLKPVRNETGASGVLFNINYYEKTTNRTSMF